MKILAVDDDPIILELLAQFVDAFGGYTLTTAESGFEALEIIAEKGSGKFDCFMLDIQMPGMDGVELAGLIRDTARYADAPILMLTAMSEKRYIDAAFTAGATDYVTKPFEVVELKSRLTAMQKIVMSRKSRTRKIFSTKALATQSAPAETTIALHEPISIYDVDNVIECVAMENYVAQLSRSAQFGSTVFALSIRRINEFHEALTGFEFHSMISDVAEVISDTLSEHQFLMSYAGNGTFVCIVEAGWRPEMASVTEQVNLSLAQAELFANDGQRIQPRLCAGKAIRLVWKSNEQILDSLGVAQSSAEDTARRYDSSMSDLFLYGQSA
ncbi:MULTISPECIES: response regulator [unclassified Sulfitobacter]|uniref:response regulator n=1 Tax=unclassified Sulfitobacter TaxID=196795 RepID=UPI0007C310E1|nr:MULTISPECIES: response regulator [unclassified Sulfitobacter]KZY05971.1 two-component system response regulator [Sulfitobacter sp. HI0023]KZY24558.1 two-component system response regulator [Sulfitobacter sp. HI0040]KZZ63236.1 two-component system response regulator [Sulfitobacter sp. HI0129]MBO29719.1 response regulator [Paracoccaceae bacterium]|tara:strand:- start:530 stop:1513 length:984 start_codon:yes stop_codon:yes gene_type:complete